MRSILFALLTGGSLLFAVDNTVYRAKYLEDARGVRTLIDLKELGRECSFPD